MYRQSSYRPQRFLSNKKGPSHSEKSLKTWDQDRGRFSVLRQVPVCVAGQGQMGGFRLYRNEQHFSDHSNICLRHVSGSVCVIVRLAPVAPLYRSYTTGCCTGGRTASVGKGPGEGCSPLDDAVRISIRKTFLCCDSSTQFRKKSFFIGGSMLQYKT